MAMITKERVEELQKLLYGYGEYGEELPYDAREDISFILDDYQERTKPPTLVSSRRSEATNAERIAGLRNAVVDILGILQEMAERLKAESTNETKAGAGVQAVGTKDPTGPLEEGSTPSPGPTDADEITTEKMLCWLDGEDWALRAPMMPPALADEGRAIVAAIRSRLAAPRVSVSREWVEERMQIPDRYSDLQDVTDDNAVAMLKELGVEVAERGEEEK